MVGRPLQTLSIISGSSLRFDVRDDPELDNNLKDMLYVYKMLFCFSILCEAFIGNAMLDS